MNLGIQLVRQPARFRRLDERGDVAVFLRQRLDRVEENGLSRAAQPEQDLRSIVTPGDHPLQGDFGFPEDGVAPREFWRL